MDREILGTVAHETRMVDKKWLEANASWKDFSGDYEFLEGEAPDETLYNVNRYVNELVTYKKDIGDDWINPERMLTEKAGDCEDFAMFKRGILKTLGFDDMLILVVRDLVARQEHAMLGVWLDGDPDGYILDNRTVNLNSRLIRESELFDMIMVVSLDDDHAYLHGRKIS